MTSDFETAFVLTARSAVLWLLVTIWKFWNSQYKLGWAVAWIFYFILYFRLNWRMFLGNYGSCCTA